MVGMQVRKPATFFCFILYFGSSAKSKRRRAFDEEWGSVGTEGHIWWRGNAYEEWIDVMGKSWIGWICELFAGNRLLPLIWFQVPIGRGLRDGLSYPINPRFDSDGWLRRRSEWPEDLR
jgi:palmitoyltransferase